MAAVAYGSLPFAEQIDFFRRKVPLPTLAWTDIWQEAHDLAFVVAGANRMDLVTDFQEAIEAAIAEGETLEQFRKRFDAIVAKYGWEYNGGRNWRSRVIYETNLRTSYAAGRFAQLQALKKVRPFWRYRHSDAVQHPRPLHLAWNGLVLGADDPWWQTHYPPNGWGCQCTVEGLNARDLKRLGKDGPDQAPPLDMRTVTVGTRGPTPRTVDVPAGVDPGFGYMPGRSAWAQRAQEVIAKSAALPAEAGADAVASLLDIAPLATALDDDYAAFQADVLARAQTRKLAMAVGALEPDVVAALAREGIVPQAAPIIARDEEVLHALRASKASIAGKLVALAAEELALLPALLRKPNAILLDRADGVLLYIVDNARRGVGKIVIAIDYSLKTADGRSIVNSFRTASLVELADLIGEVKGGVLVLLTGTL